MRKEASKDSTPEKVVQEIRRKTRRRVSTEEKIRIVVEGLRGEESIATLILHSPGYDDWTRGDPDAQDRPFIIECLRRNEPRHGTLDGQRGPYGSISKMRETTACLAQLPP